MYVPLYAQIIMSFMYSDPLCFHACFRKRFHICPFYSQEEVRELGESVSVLRAGCSSVDISRRLW